LEEAAVLVVEWNHFVFFEEFENIADALLAEGPMVATGMFSKYR
jgi:hypothetical protein